MNEKISRKIFIALFALLYISVAFVSTFHAIAFFGLANFSWVAVMLAITFEIGQAAVLFSILTGASGKNKVIPWILMTVLTLVQILGNVYSSYKYLITNSSDLLRYFKEPIFVWMDLPDAQCNVILTYIVGAILPIVSLLMTSMVTNYINKPSVEAQPIVDETKSVDDAIEIEPVEQTTEQPSTMAPTTMVPTTEQPQIVTTTMEPVISDDVAAEFMKLTESDNVTTSEPKKKSHFINI